MKRLIATLSLVAITLTFFACSGSSESKSQDKDQLIIYNMVPPQTAYQALKKKASAINWGTYIETKSPVKDLSSAGYEIGLALGNWTVASLNGDKAKSDTWSKNLMELTRLVDLDDEVVIANIKTKVDEIKTLLGKDDDESYRTLSREVRWVEQEITQHYKKVNNKVMLDKVSFSLWLELFYIGLKGVEQNYSEELASFFNRQAEIQYFQQKFVSENYQDIQDLLKVLEMKTPGAPGESMSQADMESLVKTIGDFRSDYLK